MAYLNAMGDGDLPPLWIDKCLYTPPLVARAARKVYARRRDAAALGA